MRSGFFQFLLVLFEVATLLRQLLVLLLEHAVDLLNVHQPFLREPQLGRIRLVQFLQIKHVVRDGKNELLTLINKLLLVVYCLLHGVDESLVFGRHVQERIVHVNLRHQLVNLERVEWVKGTRRFYFHH